MSHTPGAAGTADHGELAHLIAALCDGHATTADRDRLELLLAQPTARAEYIATMRVHAELLWRWHRRRPLRLTTRPLVPLLGSRRLWAAAVGVAAACLLAVSLIGWPWAVKSRPAIRLTAVADARLAATSPPYGSGDMLAPGDRIDLEAGLVELALPAEIVVVLEGPARLEIREQDDLQLDQGRLTATLTRRGSGLTVRTPTAVVTDRGTQFGLDVDTAGRTDLRVFQGAVELAATADPGSQPAVVTAGNAAEVDADGRVALVDRPPRKAFVLTVPRPKSALPQAVYPWHPATAETLLDDPLAGEGLLAGSSPADRSGSGDVPWLAPTDWSLDPDTGVLRVRSPGAALLPFRPEAGRIYRIAATLQVLEGSWAAIGLATRPNTAAAGLDYAWMLQRQTTSLRLHDTARTIPNAAYLGPGQAGRIGRGDTRTGSRRRTIVLDTTGSTWQVFFLVDDLLIGTGELVPPADGISHLAVSVFENTVATISDVRVDVCQPP